MPRTYQPPALILNRNAVSPTNIKTYGVHTLRQLAIKAGIDPSNMRRMYARQQSASPRTAYLFNKAFGSAMSGSLLTQIDEPITFDIPGDPGYDPGEWNIGTEERRVRPST